MTCPLPTMGQGSADIMAMSRTSPSTGPRNTWAPISDADPGPGGLGRALPFCQAPGLCQAAGWPERTGSGPLPHCRSWVSHFPC